MKEKNAERNYELNADGIAPRSLILGLAMKPKTKYPIPYTLYPIVFISYSSISKIPGGLTTPPVFVDRHGGLAYSDLPVVVPIVFFMRRRGVLATG